MNTLIYIYIYIYLSLMQEHSSATSTSTATLSHRKPTSVGTFRDSCGAQNSDETKRTVATRDKTNEVLSMLHVCLPPDGLTQ
jgi:hypothetical protein